MTLSTVVGTTSGRPAKGTAGTKAGGRAGRFFRRTLLLLLAAALVVSIGTVVTSLETVPPPLSTTEQARLDARQRLLAVAGDLRHLASVEGNSNNDDGGPALLLSAASALEQQAGLFPLQTTWPSGAAAPDSDSGDGAGILDAEAPSPMTTKPPSREAGAPTLEGTLQRLASTSRFLLSSSLEVEPGLARLLASVGASVFSQASLLHEAYPDTEQPVAWRPDVVDSPAECGRPGTEEQESQSSAPGGELPAEAQAASAVVVSEYKLAFLYQATLPRITGAQREAAAENYAAHRDLMERWEELAADACVDLPLREPAYELPEGFLDEPWQGLGEAERDAALALGDLVALGDGALQAAAAADLPGAAERIAAITGEPPLTPGLALRASGNAVSPSGTSETAGAVPSASALKDGPR
ncbi:ferritin-like domain-containing protein [Arthrobacter sp. VKM Ac-2550]|uniref:ferritin-like domain-containing protein n=1 Tax=Crystallibacter permensis TaxID=1938888 RepID=UPI002226F92B|nr:ferritin-like domain-containing protein [Arthrobacter sp. VKM Ac-2550]MCW2133590.1 protein of unknown function (DUF4439) [Arthrobacter sp. VKM Ac-2550]